MFVVTAVPIRTAPASASVPNATGLVQVLSEAVCFRYAQQALGRGYVFHGMRAQVTAYPLVQILRAVQAQDLRQRGETNTHIGIETE